MGLDRDARKPNFGACKQQRRRPVFVSTQSDKRLYCSLVLLESIIFELAYFKISFFAFCLCS